MGGPKHSFPYLFLIFVQFFSSQSWESKREKAGESLGCGVGVVEANPYVSNFKIHREAGKEH